jgi:hypothetical protein
MTPTQLRQALAELDGHRDLGVAFTDYHSPIPWLDIKKAMLIPDEPDHLVKVTDGKYIYILDAERVAWIRIELKKPIA